MKEETTYGMNPERIARLLAIGLETADAEDDLSDSRTTAEVLREMLESKLPLDPTIPDSLPAVLDRPCDDLLPPPSQTLQDLLLDSQTGLTVVKALKDYSKELTRRRREEATRAAATVIYYASIANALVFHDKRITQHSYGKLQKAYEDLEQKKWIPSDLKRLLKKAKAACQQRKG